MSEGKKQSTLKELLDFHEKFILGLPKCKTISPQICVSKNNEVNVVIIIGGRDEIKAGIELASASKPDWIVEFNEGYMEEIRDHTPKEIKKELGDTAVLAEKDFNKFIRDYEVGELERRFKDGDKNVIEVVIIQAYNKQEKIMRVIDKYTGKRITEDLENFDGFLTVNDVDRVFW
jgi:hypothetical protein